MAGMSQKTIDNLPEELKIKILNWLDDDSLADVEDVNEQ